MTDPPRPKQKPEARTGNVEAQPATNELVKVARAQNQAEAEFLQNMLLNEGMPSVLRRAPGFDVPDFLAAGPRDVLVRESDARHARDLLVQPELESTLATPTRVGRRVIVGAVLIAIALVTLIVCVNADVL